MVLAFYEQLRQTLNSGKCAVLILVIESIGSSPGRKGFKMIVTQEDMYGTIGGGIMEHKFVELSRSLLQEGSFSTFLRRQIHQGEATSDRSGMICSGEQTLTFYFLDQSNLDTIEKICQNPQGAICYSERGVDFLDKYPGNSEVNQDSSPYWTYIEPIGLPDKVFVVGGGHVSLALCEILSKLQFEIHVLDHRDALNTMEVNTFASEKSVVNFEEIDRFIPEGDQHYVVIMSFGYRTDEIVIKRLLGRKYKYLGMMGSKAKTKVLFNSLLEQGFEGDDLSKVFAPIGLDISSQTTHEIAISIAAQLIQVRRSNS